MDLPSTKYKDIESFKSFDQLREIKIESITGLGSNSKSPIVYHQ